MVTCPYCKLTLPPKTTRPTSTQIRVLRALEAVKGEATRKEIGASVPTIRALLHKGLVESVGHSGLGRITEAGRAALSRDGGGR